VFETVTVAGYIDRKSKKQESGQMRIILHAGANTSVIFIAPQLKPAPSK
jgi:hypothetical protein